MILSPFLTFPCDCDKACRRVQSQLAQAGLRAVQTFDLQSARHALSECPCPHHGTAECDCQMVVLLVYGKAEEPLTLILHGNQGITDCPSASSKNYGPVYGTEEQAQCG